jgi:hypothetical protein
MSVRCDRYPDRPVLDIGGIDEPDEIKAGCTHGHPSAFAGEDFACGGNLEET